MAEDVQKGTGADQLPQGAATQLNENLDISQAEQQAGTTETAVAAVQPERALPQDYEPKYSPDNEDDKFIVGPTTRPNEPLTAGTIAPGRLSPELRRSLPQLVKLASEPGASPRLQMLVQLLLQQEGR